MPERVKLLPPANADAVFASCLRLMLGRLMSGLMPGSGAACADGFVWNISDPALHPIVDGDLADRAESFVVKGRHAEGRAQLFVEPAKILQMKCERRQLQSIVCEQKFLVAGIPQARELSFDHDGRQHGELEFSVSALAKFRAAAVFFDAHDATRTANRKAEGGKALD